MLIAVILVGALLLYLTGFVVTTREINRWRAKNDDGGGRWGYPQSPFTRRRDIMVIQNAHTYGAFWMATVPAIAIFWAWRQMGCNGKLCRLLNPAPKLPKAEQLKARITELERELGIDG